MRITGGTAKGRVIDAPRGRNTRPTASIVREAVFGILGAKVDGSSVLDLFCGSGAMAFEALSRGAKFAVLIDMDSEAIRTAKNNADRLGFGGRCAVYRNDFMQALQILNKKSCLFDIVFIDPPYSEGLYKKALDGVFQSVAKKGCIAVCEHAPNIQIEYDPDLVKPGLTRKYGSRAITLFTEAN